jgi:beta-lactam-binding protein with PASTA domain
VAARTPVPPLPVEDLVVVDEERATDAASAAAAEAGAPEGAPRGDEPTAEPSAARSGHQRGLTVAAAAVAAAVGVAALAWSLMGGDDGQPPPTTPISATVAPSSAPTGTTADLVPTIGTEAGPTIPTAPATATVPDVQDRFATPDAVEQALREAGFVTTRVPQASPDVPLGTVIALDPAAGTTVAPSATVKVFVSTGSADAEVPAVDGQPADAAQQAIEAAGFVVRRETVSNPFLADGLVIETSPSAGTRALKGVVVVLRVSSGPESPSTQPTSPPAPTPPSPSTPTPPPPTPPTPPTPPPPPPPVGPRIPNVVGLSAQDAQARLRAQGFSPSRQADVCSTSQDGLVVSQDPPAGPAEAGGTVYFTVGSALLC